jgi:hypothetical protein
MKKLMALILAITVLGCSSSRITTSWKAKDEAPKKFNKIMVIALLKQNDGALKKQMEDHLVGDLKTAGYTAISCIDEYGPRAFATLEEDKVIEQLRNKGFDAVMTIVLLDKQQERDYVPGRINHSPYYIYQNRFWGYYRTINTRIETPGYYSTTTNYFWESNFYDMTAKKLLYSVQTESFQPSSAGSLAHEYGKMIVADMLKQQILLNNSVGFTK